MNESPNGWLILVPWPARVLNPTTKVPKSQREMESQRAENGGFYLVKGRGTRLNDEKRYKVELLFCPPDSRRFQLKNVMSAFDPWLRGMLRGWCIGEENVDISADIGPIIERGKVEVKIYET